MKKVERTNVVIVYSNQQTGFVLWWDPYTMEVDCGNKNCYNYRDFRHMVRHYGNRRIRGRIGEERRLKYSEDGNNGERRMIEGGNR